MNKDNYETIEELELIVQEAIGSTTVADLLNPPKETWIQTYTGKRFNPLNPKYEDIDIEDIAHALSMQCRFTGHCQEFYSVAQHSVLVSYICNMEDALYGLLHDASEAYITDISSPLKRSGKFDFYIDIEKVLQEAVYKKFGLSHIEPESVKKADKILLATEARDLMGPLHKDWRSQAEPLLFKIDPMSPKEAKQAFLKRFNSLVYSNER